MSEREARLLRALARELSAAIAPQIESASGKERLRFANMMLTRMAADLDIEHEVLSKRPLGKPVIVHGDCAPHNLLKHDGRVAAILDWELSHIGDAGEDLGYCRRTVERLLPWEEFMRHYRAAGAEDVDERRVLMGNIWGHLRNSTFSAGSAREFHDGRADDFAQGAFGYFVLPRLEMLLAPLVEQAWTLETEH